MTRPAIRATVILFLSAAAYAQPDLGGRAGAAFRLGFSAEGMGMGNALVAVVGRDVDPIMNPSIAPFQRTPVVTVGAAFFALDRSVQTLSYAAPLPPAAGVAFSLQRVSVGNIDGRDRNGVPTEKLRVAENLIALSFGLRPTVALTLGVTAKLLHAQMVEGLTSTTVGLDFGATYLVMEGLRVAVAARDVNSKYRWDTASLYGREGRQTTDAFPTRLLVGASYSPSFVPGVFSVEGESVAGGFLARTGVEARLHPMLRVRSGFDAIDPSGTLGARWSTGASVEATGLAWNPSFDYCYIVEPYAPGGAHMLTVRLHIRE